MGESMKLHMSFTCVTQHHSTALNHPHMCFAATDGCPTASGHPSIENRHDSNIEEEGETTR